MEVLGEMQYKTQLESFSGRLGRPWPCKMKWGQHRPSRPNQIFDGWVIFKNDCRSALFNKTAYSSWKHFPSRSDKAKLEIGCCVNQMVGDWWPRFCQKFSPRKWKKHHCVGCPGLICQELRELHSIKRLPILQLALMNRGLFNSEARETCKSCL